MMIDRLLTKRGQTFSFDLLIALVVMGVVLAIVLAVIFGGSGNKEKVQSLEGESTGLAERFVTTKSSELRDPFSFIVDNQVDQNKLIELISKDYQAAKLELGARNDFIIYFKEEDGSLSELKAGTGVFCYGSQEAYVVAGDEAVACCSKVDATFFRADPALNAGCLS